MSSNPKTENEIECLVDVEYELDGDGSGYRRTLLIKHDYYSSDTEHGRYLLDSFLKSLNNSKFTFESVILIDSGVRLADSDIIRTMAQNGSVNTFYICSESLENYGLNAPEYSHTLLSSADIFDMILWLQSEGEQLIIIE